MSHKKIFGFKEQLNVGNSGEDLFIKLYKDLNPSKGDGKIEDIILGDSKTIEIKTDSYDINKTPNLFIEHYGNISKKKFGGPWRALNDNIDYFVYLFIKQRHFFWFSPKKLVERVELLHSRNMVESKYIRNPHYETLGYIVNRNLLTDIIIREDNFK